jgi:phenylpyruvate tautomerase PptA (4-oxalocrotonate tautomerase family)
MSMAARTPATEPEIGEKTMPIVTIQLTREGSGPGRDAVTAEEKATLIQGVGTLLRDVLGKPLEATFVVKLAAGGGGAA